LPKPKQYVIMPDCDLQFPSSATIAFGVLMVATHVPEPWLATRANVLSLHSDDKVTHEAWVPFIFVIILQAC